MAARTRVEVVAAAAMGVANRTEGEEDEEVAAAVEAVAAAAVAVVVVTTVAVVAMSPEVVEVAVEAEVAWGRCLAGSLGNISKWVVRVAWIYLPFLNLVPRDAWVSFQGFGGGGVWFGGVTSHLPHCASLIFVGDLGVGTFTFLTFFP